MATADKLLLVIMMMMMMMMRSWRWRAGPASAAVVLASTTMTLFDDLILCLMMMMVVEFSMVAKALALKGLVVAAGPAGLADPGRTALPQVLPAAPKGRRPPRGAEPWGLVTSCSPGF